RFYRINTEEQVAVVHIKSAYVDTPVLIQLLTQAPVQRFDIINISFLDSKDRRQQGVGVFGISSPGNVAEVIFASFIHLDIDKKVACIIIVLCICYDLRITITNGVIIIKDLVLIFLIFF